MKVNDSGMPEEDYWNSLFDIPRIVNWLNIDRVAYPIVDCGCGYGTFALPIAKKTSQVVYALDMEPSAIEIAKTRAFESGIHNVDFRLRDCIEDGTGLETSSVGMVLLFNILHFEERRIVLEEASRILRPSGVIAIIHWRKDIQTPRGPDCHLRPDQETILNAIDSLDLNFEGNSKILKPYHWGIQLVKVGGHDNRKYH